MNELIQTEVLVIGCGVAGGTAALRLADLGIPVTVVTSAREPHESNTYYAQGGIIYKGAGDSSKKLEQDILAAGAGLSHPEMVRILSEEGPGLVESILLERLAVPFERDENGELSLVREGAHHLSRIIHSTDATGKAIEIALLNVLSAHPNVTLLTGVTAVDLLTPGHHSRNRLSVYDPPSCVGAYLLDQASGRVVRCLSKKPCWPAAAWGKFSFALPIRPVRAAMAWPWRSAPAPG